MKSVKKLVVSLVTFCLMFGALSITSFASEEYTYTVTIYSGNQGTFNGTTGLSTSGSVSAGSEKIVITGLKYGSTVAFDAHAGAVTLKDSEKYYVKGVKSTGRDNSTSKDASYYVVTGDADFVVSYAVKGDNMVNYTVNYQDKNGKELRPSQTYVGEIGDKPVIAYLEVEKYVPVNQALTKTLVADESQNVFTFVYTPYVPEVTVTTTTVTQQNNNGNGGNGNAVIDGDADGDGAGDAIDNGNGGNNGDNGGLRDLDDEETPTENKDLSQDDDIPGTSKMPMILGGIVALLAFLALILGFVFMRKKSR